MKNNKHCGDNAVQGKINFGTESSKKEQDKNEKDFKGSFEKLFPSNDWLTDIGVMFPFEKRGYSKIETNFFRELILEKIENAENSISLIETNDSSEIIDMANHHIINSSTQHFNDNLKRNILNLKLTLVRIEKGNYGLCSKTGKIIHPKRLYALPHATERAEEKTK